MQSKVNKVNIQKRDPSNDLDICYQRHASEQLFLIT